MTVLQKIRKFFRIRKSKTKKRIPSTYVSELDLSKGYMVISDVTNEKIVNIDLYDQKCLASKRLSRSCSDINNKIVYKDNVYIVEMRKLLN